MATLEASDALRAYERELVHEAERRLGAALAEAWPADDAADAPADPQTAGPLTAAVWLAAARVIVVEQRAGLGRPASTRAGSAAVAGVRRPPAQPDGGAPAHDQRAAGAAAGRDTGWPQSVALQAG